ncbi:MAG: hypothetical protein PF445_07245 [Melioribacteraceae bacterium]|jgi:hypothetical protein|nr:hypothetical protein [Melioribacteraceae bacterium]
MKNNQKLVDVICFVLGSFLTVYFISNYAIGGDSRVELYFFYYKAYSKFGIAFGVSLIVIGFVVRSWRKLANDN